jgi:hypothetical protein
MDEIKFSRDNLIELILLDKIMRIAIENNINYYEVLDLLKKKDLL